MSADKRTPHTDALETLGLIHQFDEPRDAIHIAVIAVTAAMHLEAGDHIKLVDNKAYACEPYEGPGIADPFIIGTIQPNDKFWLVIYPRKITSLRHVWSHPDIPEEVMNPTGVTVSPDAYMEARALLGDPIPLAMKQMREDADEMEVSYEWLMGACEDAYNGDGYQYHPDDRGKGEGMDVPNRVHDNYRIIMKIDDSVKKEDWYFTCSC